MVISFNPKTKAMKISGDNGQLMSNPKTGSSKLPCKDFSECHNMVRAIETVTGKTLHVQPNPDGYIFLFKSAQCLTKQDGQKYPSYRTFLMEVNKTNGGVIMALQGETIATGASSKCPDCQVELKLEVLRSGGGYYIGTQCHCGPYSRESGYYPTAESAQRDLDSDAFGRF